MSVPRGLVALPHWALLQARGADAASFLHGQLTQDMLSLGDALRLAGYCSAKGRLLASFLAWQAGPEEILLACDAGVAPTVARRLAMFVLRARCRIVEAGAGLACTGLLGDVAEAACAAAGLDPAEPASPRALGRQRSVGAGWLLRLPAVDGVARAIAVAPPGAALPGGVDAATAPAAALADWQRLEVRSGLARIEPATADLFVPQMLNYELVGGVDFQKGCYPGQEVVARSQYRGTIKRRTLLFRLPAQAAPAQEVFHDGDPGQPAGQVVNVAPAGAAGEGLALVEVKRAALDGGSLHLGAPDGPTLRQEPLPYALPADAA
ncbi:CAF17-like 4Fe-4S cluster assembly/insertion protein YgfZ [Piscinibacter sakaiensis]|nr:folate-binding protein [Piscinibacter sakaiensis]